MTTAGLSHSDTRVAAEVDRQAARKKTYIVGAVYDWAFFLLPPTLALLIGAGMSGTWFTKEQFTLFGTTEPLPYLFIGAFIHAHLFAVFFRSHGNPEIFRQFRIRFIVVPIALFIGMMSSLWVLVSVSVLATFWDVYHSGLQTFGFARIYDGRVGNDPQTGRRLDWWLNHLMYAGPIVAGATMIDHFNDFGEFATVRSVFFTSVPIFMMENQRYFTWAILAAGALFLVFYVVMNVLHHRAGRRVSFQKVFLLASTGAVSIYSWGFNTFGEAFFIMNFFHALQYFALVWAMEKKTMRKRFRLDGFRGGLAVTFALFIGLSATYGILVGAIQASVRWFYALTLVVSIMHFWYDGFIWSVRRKAV